jgi:hypothetical protein
MVRQATVFGLLAGLAVPGPIEGARASDARREKVVDFELDDAFQADGGVQIFFELIGAPAAPVAGSTLARFHVLDRTDRLGGLTEPVHVVAARLSYVLEKDISFFTRERLLDVAYIRTIAPDMDVTAVPDGGFQVGQAPRNRFTLTFHADASTVPPAIVSLARARGAPVLVQENADFARIMGWRTAAWSTTWTFHEALGPRRTRVTVLTMSYLYNLPPFFVGGGDRVYADTLARTQAIIARLRDYAEPAPR